MADHEQFLEAFLNYQANLLAFIGALVRNREDCQDVFQETAMTLWRKHDEYDPGRPFAAWAKGIAVNKVLQYRTRSGRVPTAFAPETIGAIVDALERKELRQASWPVALDALEECVKTLSEHLRELLSLRYANDWSMARIAEHTGSTPAAVKMSVSRIRKRLYDCVQQQLEHPVERPQ